MIKVKIVKKTKPYYWYQVGRVYNVEDFNELYWRVVDLRKKYILKDDTDFDEAKSGKYKIYDENNVLYPTPRMDHIKDVKLWFLQMERVLLKEGYNIIRRKSNILSASKDGKVYHLICDNR